MNEARVHERLDELRTLLPADWTFAWMEQDDPAYAWVASASAPKLHRLGEGGDFIYAFSAATKAEALEGLIAEVRRRRNPRSEAPRTAHDAEARLGSFVHQMHPTKTLPEKEALQLHALLTEYRAAVEAEAASLDSDELRKAVEALRVGLKDALRILDGGHRGYVGDHYIRTVQVNERSVDRLRALLSAGDKAAPPPRTFENINPPSSTNLTAVNETFVYGDKAEAPTHRMGPPAWEPGLAHDEWANRCVTCHELWPCAGDKAEAPR